MTTKIRNARVLPATLLLALYVPGLFAQQDVRSGLPGTWNWVSGQTLIIDSGGACRVNQGSQQINTCQWTVVDAARRLVRIVHRQGGWVDTVALSADGNVLDGTNNTGARIRGQRVAAPVSEAKVNPAGTWNWVSGQTLVVEADGSCRVYQGGRQINTCQWTVVDAARRLVRIVHREGGWVDTVALSPDGNVLEGTNNAGVRVRGERASVPPPPPPPPAAPLDLNGSWSGGLLHIWQDGSQVLITATWKRDDGKYVSFRGDGQLQGRVADLAVRYSPMTHGPVSQWRGTFTVSADGNTIQALYTLSSKTDRRTYVRDR